MKPNFFLQPPSCASRASLTASSRSALCIPFCANFRDFMHLDACKEEPASNIEFGRDINYRALMEPKVNYQMEEFKLGLVMELQE